MFFHESNIFNLLFYVLFLKDLFPFLDKNISKICMLNFIKSYSQLINFYHIKY